MSRVGRLSLALLLFAACSETAAPPDASVGADAAAPDTLDASISNPDAATSPDADPPVDLGPAPDATPADPPPLAWAPHVRGTFNDWGTSLPMTYVGAGEYRVSTPISQAEHMFKIADDKWSLDTIYSSDSMRHVEVPLDTETPLVIATGYNNDAVLRAPAESSYTFSLKVASGALKLTIRKGETNPMNGPDDSAIETFPGVPYSPRALTGGSARVPAPAALFDRLAIRTAPGESAQYVVGDQVDGYYEGWTQSYTNASRYRHRTIALFSSVATLVDGALNDVTQNSTGTLILPYGAQNLFPGGVTETLVVHTHRRALSLHVHSDAAKPLAIVPKLMMRRTSTSTFQRRGDAMVFMLDRSQRSDGNPVYVAVVGSKPHTQRGVDLTAQPTLESVVGITGSMLKPIFTTSNPETDFRLTLAFAPTAEEAQTAALALARTDAIDAEQQATYDFLTQSFLWTDDEPYSRALMWARSSAYRMVVEEYGKGIWAGLPWFKNNWGRDTFISLPGTLLVNGAFDDARGVIRAFSALQQQDPTNTDYGRVPNLVNDLNNLNYNTVDGTPWMIREVLETARYTGDEAFLSELYPVVRRYLEGATQHHVDTDGLLTHGDTATWMDAAFGSSTPFLAWSARGPRAVEVQALWYEALQIGAELARRQGETTQADAWSAQAAQVRAAFATRFWDTAQTRLADRVRADGTRDLKARPNQLLVMTVPFGAALLDPEREAQVLKSAVSELLYPYGIASLAQTHRYFHPFHDRQARYNKDAAYHNGTVWGWNAGFTTTALVRHGRVELAYALAQNLGRQMLTMGTRGSMSELLDAHPRATGELVPSGTFSQTWSVAEFARNGFQDFLGVRPNLLADRIDLEPSIPAAWSNVAADVPFGQGEKLSVDLVRTGTVVTFTLTQTRTRPISVVLHLLSRGARYAVPVTLVAGVSTSVRFDPLLLTAAVDGRDQGILSPERGSQDAVLGPLRFLAPNVGARFETLDIQDFLKGVIERGEFE